MTISYATGSGRITEPGGDAGIRARLIATPETTNGALRFPAEEPARLTWGPQIVETDDDGLLPDTFKVPLDSDLGEEVVWRFTVEPLENSSLPKRWIIAKTPITADFTIAEIANVDLTAISTEVYNSVAENAEAVLAVVATNDGIMTAVAQDEESDFAGVLSATIGDAVDPAPALAGVQVFNNGTSWGDKAAAIRYAAKKFAQRQVLRFGMQPLDPARDVAAAGYTAVQVQGLAETYWVPNDWGMIFDADCLVNNRDPGGTVVTVDTAAESTRSRWDHYMCKARVLNTSPSVQFGGGWTSGVSSTTGAAADVVFTGDKVSLNFGYGVTAGQATVKDAAGTTLATVNVGGYSTSFTGTVRLAGFGVGTHTIRVAVVSGTVELKGYRIPSSNPPTSVWQVPIVNAVTNLPALVTACKAIMSDYPTVIAVDPADPPNPDDPFVPSAMIGPDLTHLTDEGQSWYDRNAPLVYLDRGLTFRQGQNRQTVADVADTPYSVVSPPTYNRTSPVSTVPAAPTGLGMTPSSQITGAWAAPLDDGGRTITSYNMQARVTSVGGAWTSSYTGISPTALTNTITSGLTGGTGYDFQVQAVNGNGPGAWSATATGTPVAPFDILAVTGRKVILRADSITGLVNSDPVASWTDESGQGNDVAQATAGFKPLYKTAIQNSLPMVLFDGADDYLRRATFTGGTLSQPITMFIVCKVVSYVASSVIVDSASTTSRLALREISANWSMFAGTTLSSSTAINTTTAHLLELTDNGVSSTLALDGTIIATGDAGAHTMIGLTLGANATPGSYAPVYIGEIGVFAPIPTGDLANIRSYLKAKWGTP